MALFSGPDVMSIESCPALSFTEMRKTIGCGTDSYSGGTSSNTHPRIVSLGANAPLLSRDSRRSPSRVNVIPGVGGGFLHTRGMSSGMGFVRIHLLGNIQLPFLSSISIEKLLMVAGTDWRLASRTFRSTGTGVIKWLYGMAPICVASRCVETNEKSMSALNGGLSSARSYARMMVTPPIQTNAVSKTQAVITLVFNTLIFIIAQTIAVPITIIAAEIF